MPTAQAGRDSSASSLGGLATSRVAQHTCHWSATAGGTTTRGVLCRAAHSTPNCTYALGYMWAKCRRRKLAETRAPRASVASPPHAWHSTRATGLRRRAGRRRAACSAGRRTARQTAHTHWGICGLNADGASWPRLERLEPRWPRHLTRGTAHVPLVCDGGRDDDARRALQGGAQHAKLHIRTGVYVG